MSGAPGSSDGAADWSARLPVAIGVAALGALVLLLGVWGFGARLEGALVVPGRLATSAPSLAVSHPEGGRVAFVAVSENAPVRAGQVLLRLDESAVAGEIALTRDRLNALRAKHARLSAEADGAVAFDPPAGLRRRALDSPALNELIEGQRLLFAARADALGAEIASQTSRAAHFKARLKALSAQQEALKRQRAITRRALDDQRALLTKGLAVLATVLSLEREVARLDGALGAADAELAATRGSIAEARLAIRRARTRFREQALAELRDVQARLNEAETALVALHRRREALDLRAPVAGTVQGLVARAPGAVLRPAQAALLIVPRDGGLVAEARIPPARIGALRIGQPVRLRLIGDPLKEDPVKGGWGLENAPSGRVISLSADLIPPERGQPAHYRARIRIDPGALPPGLRPGTPVEAFLLTERKRPIALLTRPLRAYIDRAFRDG